MIKRDFIDRLKSQADIVHIVNELWPLTKAGSAHKACCPFHDEKSASFNVSATKQIYKCFGCGASGDVFAFIQNFKRITFSEAVIYVASRYNSAVEYEPREPQPKSRFHNLKIR